MRRFIGRAHELGVLRDALERIRSTPDAVQPGECILIRGRRRVGKSSLVEEFLRTAEAARHGVKPALKCWMELNEG